MTHTAGPLGVTTANMAFHARGPHTHNQRRYANILCCLRDDMNLKAKDAKKAAPTPTMLNDRDVAHWVEKHYDKAWSTLEWEEVTVQLLKRMATRSAPNEENQFALQALSYMRQITPNSYVWMA